MKPLLLNPSEIELWELAKRAREAREAFTAHQLGTHGPWPAWCNDCLGPADNAHDAEGKCRRAPTPPTALALLETLEKTREALSDLLEQRTGCSAVASGVICLTK